MPIAIDTIRTAVSGPPPKGVIIAILVTTDGEDVWHFLTRYGGNVELIIPVSREDAMSRLSALAGSANFDSIEAHARAMARTSDMDVRIIIGDSPVELAQFIADGFVTPSSGVTATDRESVETIAEAVGDIAP